jgi:hypothetical protein
MKRLIVVGIAKRVTVMKHSFLSSVVCCIGILLLVSGCASIGGAKFPEPAAGFQPKNNYDVAYEKMWINVRRVLETERIGIASSDKESGRIVTDYVQGETQILAAGLLGAITTRYNYTITFEKTDSDKTRVGIICKLESMSEGLDWHDVSRDNKALVNKLENWLYQRIENSL